MNISMIRRVVVLAALGSLHCGVKSSYVPTRAPAQEIVWRFDNGLEAVKNGERVASAPGFTGLSDAVACVPEAASSARAASREHYTAWTFLGLGLAGTLGGAGLAIDGAVESDTDRALGGMAVMGGGLLGVITGALIQMAILPNAVDAVNIYNDGYSSSNACRDSFSRR